jgi:toxin ParE1/3/4
MESKVIWSEDAIFDLREIAEFIARDNPPVAASFCDKIIDHAELLAAFPKKGRLYSNEPQPIRITLYKRYRVYYTYEETTNTVTILNVWHGARLPPEFS